MGGARFYRLALKLCAVLTIIDFIIVCLRLMYVPIAQEHWCITEMVLTIILFIMSIIFLRNETGVLWKVMFTIFSLSTHAIVIVGAIMAPTSSDWWASWLNRLLIIIPFSVAQLLIIISFYLDLESYVRNYKRGVKPAKKNIRESSMLENVSLDEKGEIADKKN